MTINLIWGGKTLFSRKDTRLIFFILNQNVLIYFFNSMRPWDVSNDLLQYESEYKIQTWTRHKTPVVRTCSITSLEKQPDNINSSIRNTSLRRLNVVGEESESSCPEVDPPQDSDSSERVPGKSMYIVVFVCSIKQQNFSAQRKA